MGFGFPAMEPATEEVSLFVEVGPGDAPPPSIFDFIFLFSRSSSASSLHLSLK